MICVNIRCKREISEEMKFCPYCGKQQRAPRRPRRLNGSGSIVYRKDCPKNPWQAYAPMASTYDRETDSVLTARHCLGSFPTRTDAQKALDLYQLAPTKNYTLTLAQVYAKWYPIGTRGLSQKMVDGYVSAWNKLRPLWKMKMVDIRTADYQAVIDYYDSEHPKESDGGRVVDSSVLRPPLSFSSLSKIKILAGMLNRYAIEQDFCNKNYAEFIVLPPKGDAKRERFTDLELKKIEMSSDPICDLIYILCHTGHRISEFVSFTRKDIRYNGENIIFYGGNKTERGRNKVVPVSRKISERVQRWIDKNGETIFCRENGSAWTADNFRDYMADALERIGVRRLTPHACRRTFSTRLSAAGVSQQDIIALMGHTDFAVDIEHYINQSADTLVRAVEKMG